MPPVYSSVVPSDIHIKRADRGVTGKPDDDRFAPRAATTTRYRTAVIAASDELITREITDKGTDQLPGLAPTVVELATRLLTSTWVSS